MSYVRSVFKGHICVLKSHTDVSLRSTVFYFYILDAFFSYCFLKSMLHILCDSVFVSLI